MSGHHGRRLNDTEKVFRGARSNTWFDPEGGLLPHAFNLRSANDGTQREENLSVLVFDEWPDKDQCYDVVQFYFKGVGCLLVADVHLHQRLSIFLEGKKRHKGHIEGQVHTEDDEAMQQEIAHYLADKCKEHRKF